MRKFLFSVLSLVTTISLVTPSLALAAASSESETSQVQTLEEKQAQNEQTYSYTFKGIKFTGNQKLSEKRLEQLYQGILLETGQKNKVVKPNINDPGGGGAEVIIGPIYKHYDNGMEREVAKAIVAYLLKKLPSKVTDSFLVNWTAIRLSGWVDDAMGDTYVGAWGWKVEDSDDECTYYYETVVHYEDDSYKKPLDVQYYETDRRYW
ncbi:hypothetical protein LOK74_16085 [Brevibacillus humidisoli]|uniref:hypothetical protein n=1 Tax=Brevibacillus humidisoli TaxID=2895522 RepID=UPI001E643511|nr:hypothetical protein [Brevibacillus humidisoli]UFJ39566.1 hypothetical protein LOK74_16085 [Brevibacillus humidisoli]